jgi:hypothetical protein
VALIVTGTTNYKISVSKFRIYSKQFWILPIQTAFFG